MKATLTLIGETDGVHKVYHYDTLAIYRAEMDDLFHTLLMGGTAVKVREVSRNSAVITYRF